MEIINFRKEISGRINNCHKNNCVNTDFCGIKLFRHELKNDCFQLSFGGKAENFWGVENQNTLNKSLYKQCCLTLLKLKELNCVNLGICHVSNLYDKFWNQKPSYYERINTYGKARLTICTDGNKHHTIGFLKHNDTLFILDSLGNGNNEARNLHQQFANLLDGHKGTLKRIIFNNRPQQVCQCSCNNWTWANLEKLDSVLKKDNIPVNSAFELDNILYKDSEESDILAEQQDYLLKNMHSLSNENFKRILLSEIETEL